MTARTDLAEALAELAPETVSIVDAPPRNAAPPFLAIAPGSPYLRPSTVAGCIDDWRLDVWCVVAREAIFALDEQDALVAIVRAAVDTMPLALWLGVDRANVSADDLAGVPYLAAIAQVRVHTA